jgi:capsule polysaccharide export protein KpsE/RkpR
MRTPLNTSAELIVKLEGELTSFNAQLLFIEGVLLKNAEGITALEPIAEWGEETTP